MGEYANIENLSDNIMIKRLQQTMNERSKSKPKKEYSCVFCGKEQVTTKYLDKYVCCDCFHELELFRSSLKKD